MEPSDILALIIAAVIGGVVGVISSHNGSDPSSPEESLRKVYCEMRSGTVSYDGYSWGTPYIYSTASKYHKFEDPITGRQIHVTGECSSIPVTLDDLQKLDPEYAGKILRRKTDGG